MSGRALATLVALVVVLAGCGSDDGESDGAAGETIEITETDFALDPDSVTADAAGRVTFHVVNDGGTTHALEVEGGDVEEETDGIVPGESADLTVELEEGEYELYCPIDGHREQGMEGTLVVGSGAGAASTDDEGDGGAGTDTDRDYGYGG